MAGAQRTHRPGATQPIELGSRKHQIGSIERCWVNDNTATVRRNPDGSIDMDFYKTRARRFRNEAVGAWRARVRGWIGRLWRRAQ